MICLYTIYCTSVPLLHRALGHTCCSWWRGHERWTLDYTPNYSLNAPVLKYLWQCNGECLYVLQWMWNPGEHFFVDESSYCFSPSMCNEPEPHPEPFPARVVAMATIIIVFTVCLGCWLEWRNDSLYNNISFLCSNCTFELARVYKLYHLISINVHKMIVSQIVSVLMLLFCFYWR